ncbi:MAG: DNA primase [Chloroflexota bacterium]
MSVADEIKARLDIVDYIQRYVPLKRAGRTWKAPCPFHAEKTPSFVVDPERQSWRCFGACATGGDVITFAMKQNGWSFSDALQELGKLTGVEVRQRTPEQRAQDDQLDKLRGMLQTSAEAYHNLLLDSSDAEAVAVLRYAREKRGLSDETIRQFGIGYAPAGWNNMLDHLKLLGYSEDQVIETGLAVRNEESGRIYDRFRNRLMIPIRDERGRVTGFGARALNPEDNPKYLNSPQTALFDKSHTLFGLDVAKRAIADTETAVIVEGYMDAIQAHQAGFYNVVAQMGTAMTEAQLKLIAPKWAKKIVLALDSDAAGQNATMRSLEVARQTLQADYSGRLSVDIRVLHIPDAKDPDDLIREAPERWAALVEGAQPVAEFVIEAETSTLPAQASVQEREALARRVLPILLASENNLYKKDNVQKLALKLRIAERDLLAWADEQARLRKPSPPPRDHALKVLRDDLLEPPDAPVREYDEADAPPPGEGEDGYDSGLRIQPARRVVPAREAAMEAYCLKVLFRRPESFYAVNRKLRQLGGTNRALLDGPLNDWSAEDFSHSDYRALMSIFRAALDQDEMELFDYLRAQCDEALKPHLDIIFADDLDGVRTHLRNGLKADLGIVWDRGMRVIASVDMQDELLEKALRLRMSRLQREREELGFLQLDAQASEDSAAQEQFQGQIILSSIAKGLIEAELQKQMSVLRE